MDDVRDRLLAAQALEAARCIEEQVITDPLEADVGAILGWGFAPWTGGPLSYIDGIGVAAFVVRCDALADRYGSDPPATACIIATASARRRDNVRHEPRVLTAPVVSKRSRAR